MKHHMFAIFSALFASAAFGQTFQLNGGKPIQLKNSDTTGVVIPITLQSANAGDVVVSFDTSATINMAACQLTFPANSTGMTQSITVYPVSDVVTTSAYQVTMNIFAATVPGVEGGPCTSSTLPIVLSPVINAPGVCSSTGRRHIQSFDGAKFDNMGMGGYLLFQSADKATVIQAYQYRMVNDGRDLTYNIRLAVKQHDSFLLMSGPDFEAGVGDVLFRSDPGKSNAITYSCTKSALIDTYFYNTICEITLLDGIVIKANWNYDVDGTYRYVHGDFQLTIPGTSQNKVSGICGNFNGDASDDGDYAESQIFQNNMSNDLFICQNYCSLLNNVPRSQVAVAAPVSLGSKCNTVGQPNVCKVAPPKPAPTPGPSPVPTPTPTVLPGAVTPTPTPAPSSANPSPAPSSPPPSTSSSSGNSPAPSSANPSPAPSSSSPNPSSANPSPAPSSPSPSTNSSSGNSPSPSSATPSPAPSSPPPSNASSSGNIASPPSGYDNNVDGKRVGGADPAVPASGSTPAAKCRVRKPTY